MKHSRLLLLVGLLLVVVAGVAGYMWWFRPGMSAALTTGPLDVRVGTNRRSYRYGDKVVFTSYVRNRTMQPATHSFGSTCTSAILHVDSQDLVAHWGCGMAITDVKLLPGVPIIETTEYKLVRQFSDKYYIDSKGIADSGELQLRPGTHQAYVEWQGVKSNPITFSVQE